MKNSSLGTRIWIMVISLGVLAYFGMQVVQYVADPLTTAMAYSYQVEKGVAASGYVVRSEQVLPNDSSGLLRLQRSEGERVSTGGLVAMVYADQASLDKQEEIDTIQSRLEQLQYAQAAKLGTEASLKLDAQIMQSILNLRSDLTADQLSSAEGHMSDLRSLVLKRDYTYSETEDISGQIQELQTQVKTMRSQSAPSIRRITAPVSGIYSAVVDGYEQTLTPAALADLTPTAFKAIQPDTAVQSDLGKLILGDTWHYAASITKEEASRLQESGKLHLRFAKGIERELPVTLLSVSPEENGQVVVVFQGRTFLPQLTMLRQQSAQIIQETLSGIRVPKEALRGTKTMVDKEGVYTEDEQTGLYCIVGLEARFKPVEVLYNGDGFLLVRGTSEVEKTLLRPGDEVVISAKDLFDGKVVGSE